MSLKQLIVCGLTLNLFLLSVSAFGQNKRVLVVPFDKFQFESPIPLQEIADNNQWKDSQSVCDKYNEAILSFMNEHDSTIYYPLNSIEQSKLRRILPRVYKTEPVSHFGVDIEPLIVEGYLADLLDNMGADYILFISRYKILGKLLSVRGDYGGSSRFLSWSNHLVDYEIYNREGELVAGAERFQFTPRNPRESTYSTQGTLVIDLERPSQRLSEDVSYKIDKFEQKGKVLFKYKGKKAK